MVNLHMRGRIAAVAVGLAVLGGAPAFGDFLYTGYRNSGITRVDERTGEVVDEFATFGEGFESFRGMTLGPDDMLYVSARYKGVNPFGIWGVYRFDPNTGDFLGAYRGNELLNDIAFGADGDFYAVNEWTGALVHYGGRFNRVVLPVASNLGDFVIRDDGQMFAVTGRSKIARYDVSTGERTGPITDLADLGLSTYRFDQMSFAPNGELFVTYNYEARDMRLDGGIMRFDPETGALIGTLIDDIPAFGAASGGSLGVAFGLDGNLYVGSQSAKAVLRFDLLTGAKIDEIPIDGFVESATFIEFLPVPALSGNSLVDCTGNCGNFPAADIRKRDAQSPLRPSVPRHKVGTPFGFKLPTPFPTAALTACVLRAAAA